MAACMKVQISSGGRQLLSVVYLVAAVLIVLPATSRWWRRDNGNVAHLHFFMHDVMTGPDATAVDVVNGTGRAFDVVGGLRFGQVVVMDDVLTEGPSRSSPRVGRTQGFYVFSDMHVPALLFCMNVVLTAGPYAGSTVTILGRDHITEPLRELSVVGGTGAFRMATGYVLWRTASWQFRADAVLELDVFVHTRPELQSPPPLHHRPPPPAAAASST
uniref:Dirigent protein n=1 Tax=Oryza punctata TaxID=4537 RepID=A0A0E0LG57_ORYPU